RDVDLDTFRDAVFLLHQPAVLRGVAGDWPAVRAARQSTAAICDYLKGFDRGAQAEMLIGPASIKGRFFYEDQMRGFNFARESVAVGAALDRIVAEAGAAEPRSMFMQSAPVQQILP